MAAQTFITGPLVAAINPYWSAGAGIAIGVAASTLVVYLWRRRSPAGLPAPRDEPQRQPETWKLIHEEGRHILEAQRTAAERVEGKAAIVIAGSLAAAQFIAREPVTSYALPVAEGFYLASIFCGLLCVIPRRFDNVGLEQIIRGLWWSDPDIAAAEIVKVRKDAVKANGDRHQIRVTWFWAALATLAIGATASVVHLTTGRSTDERLNGTCTELDAGTFICTASP